MLIAVATADTCKTKTTHYFSMPQTCYLQGISNQQPSKTATTVSQKDCLGVFVTHRWQLCSLVSTNELTLHQAQFVHGRVTICGQVNSLGMHLASQVNSACLSIPPWLL